VIESSTALSPNVSTQLDPTTVEQTLQRHSVVFDIIADGVVILDGDSLIVDANNAASHILGYTRDELVGKRPSIWQRAEEAAERRVLVMAAIAAHGEWSGEYTVRRKDGSTRTVESRVRSVVDASGKIVQIIAVIRDISDQRKLEVQLLQAQKLKAVGSLGAGVAHEINTPLQYVSDNMQFLEDGLQALRSIIERAESLVAAARDEPALAYLAMEFDEVVRDVNLAYLDLQLPDAANHAREGCARVREIIRALTRLAAPSSVGKVLTDINASIRDALTVSQNEWKTVANMITDLDPGLPLVPCATAELNLVLLNIVINAAQALATRRPSQPMGHITVSSRVVGEWVEIRIADDGPGISAENQLRVFDPFFTTRAPGKGIGHGLSSAHASVVDTHGGRLWVESVEGQGATFVIHLPQAVTSPQTVA
jgi:PAS domain S-box-containing protein